ncbi:MAG: hypothetical protein QW751_01935 [Candidatus Aenigmatarchaeota archaeon]|nr:hypothetical protein [Candidatus Aenigmarchaeota archaeon]
MVFARTKIMIHDDLLRPRPRMTIHFSGPDPARLYHEIPHILASVWRVSEHQIHERKFSWSKGDPEKFKISWEATKDLDRFSYYMIVVNLEGTSSKGFGNATIQVEGALRTEYPQDTIWERSLFYEFLRMTWHTVFYKSKRDTYFEEGRRLLSTFIEDLKALTRA